MDRREGESNLKMTTALYLFLTINHYLEFEKSEIQDGFLRIKLFSAWV